MRKIGDFQKKHDFLVCVDSDGCVIDGMTVKHVSCFGPGVIEVYGSKEHQEELLEEWNRINLYSMTRGINRFKGLVAELGYMAEKGYLTENFSELLQWTQTADELSNRSLLQQIVKNREAGRDTEALQKALDWSDWVNRQIAALDAEKKMPFAEAGSALKEIKKYADLAVVSSANREAVEEEWQRSGFLGMVDLLLTQEHGGKRECLGLLEVFGYGKERIVMVGDSPLDIEAAKACGVLYYPIVPREENASWVRFRQQMRLEMLGGSYREGSMERNEKAYYHKLEGR